LNLAIALGELGLSVLVVDADIGLANLDLLCGLAPRYDLGDVLSGGCELGDAVTSGPGRILIVPGAHALRTILDNPGDSAARLVAELGALESNYDLVLVDGGSGLGAGVAELAAAADQVVVVSTPEPTSIADAHAVIRRFHRMAVPPKLRVLVNQAVSAAEAEFALDALLASSRQFLGAVVTAVEPGFIRIDPHVPMAVRRRRPFLAAFPRATASRDVRRLARAVIREDDSLVHRRRAGFFGALATRRSFASTGRVLAEKRHAPMIVKA
jgi:flagellar biosynthesis protein FlhG